MVEFRCRPVLMQDEKVAQCHLQKADPFRALGVRTRTNLRRASPNVLDAERSELGEERDCLVTQGKPLRRKRICPTETAVCERGDGLRILRAAFQECRRNLRARQRTKCDAHSA